MFINHNEKHVGIKNVLGATILLLGGLFILSGNQALAYAPEGDLLKIKGYSPEVIEISNAQRSRQEWKEPSPPKQSPTERFFHNIYYGDWTGPVDSFGSGVMRGD